MSDDPGERELGEVVSQSYWTGGETTGARRSGYGRRGKEHNNWYVKIVVVYHRHRKF